MTRKPLNGKLRIPAVPPATSHYRPEGGYRIRRCHGNAAAWCLIALRADGTEIDSFGGYTTSTRLDLLLKHAGHLTPQPGDTVEFVPDLPA